MQLPPIYPDDPAWLSTFPHLVAPQPDEWFAGLLLRCDDVNHWECGATADIICPIKKYRSRGVTNWIVIPLSALELLAQLLALPMNSLLATTYQLELASLYDTPCPHATYLYRSFPFHLCPDCIAQGRLLKRPQILPHITCCPSHEVAFVRTCRCGTLIQLFPRQSLPFTCHVCCLDWAELPRITVNPERIVLEQKVMVFYTFFFENARPILFAKAQQLVRESMKRKKIDRLKCFDGNYKYVERYDGKRISLGSLVELLVSLDLSPDDVVDYEGPLPWWSVKNKNGGWNARANDN